MSVRFIVSTLAVLPLYASIAPGAVAQTSKDLVGTWTLVSSTIDKNGTKTESFGPNPHGSVIFGNDGHYALVFLRSDLPKVASNSRTSQTPEESRAIAQGSVSTYGTYAVEGKNIILHIDGSTFPNWSNAEQRRPFTLSGDELTYTTPGTTGTATQVTLRRVK